MGVVFFFNDTATTEIYTLSLHDALPISQPADDWARAEEVVRAIRLPQIPARDYPITDFGAQPGGTADARPAITAAIKKASDEGGGRVVIPPGKWLSRGPVRLASRINLHVSEGATLLFAPEARHYLPVVLTRWEGTEVYGYSPLDRKSVV